MGEALAPAEYDQSLSKPQIAQVATKDKQSFIHGDSKVPQDMQDPNIIKNTARNDAALPTIKYPLENGAKPAVLARTWVDLMVR